jgi:tripartite-type tricarboxylate transporter receptor subunit TctC
MRNLLLVLAACFLVACEAQGPQPGADAAAPAAPGVVDLSLYDGKTLNYIVATGPGGNYDAYARLIAGYMQKYLPGSRVIVKNVPGAGHIVGANTLYASRPDGLTIGTFNTGLIYTQLLERPGANFDLAEFDWIGSAAHDVRVIVMPTAGPYDSFAALKDSGDLIRVAAAGVGSAAYNDTRIVAEALHLNLEIIPGFEGNEGELSMLRGEVNVLLGAASAFANFVETRRGFYALAVSGESRELAGVPLARDFVTDERGGQLLALIEALSDLGRLTAAPPGTDPDMLATLREAYRLALNDPELLANAEATLLPIQPTYGDDVQALVLEAMDQTPESLVLLREATAVPGG